MVGSFPSDDVRVLVYEESQVQSQIIRSGLDSAGYAATFATSADDALKAAMSGQYSIFLSNIEHRDLSGMELFWRLKSEEETRGIYCIAAASSELLETTIEALDCGADDLLRKPYQPMELHARLRVASRTVALQREMLRTALTDALTQIANRRAFMDGLDREVARAKRHGSTLSVVMVDIDHFKQVNDTYGHAAGDRVICATAATLGSQFRKSDFVGRVGGEEFAVYLTGTASDMAVSLAERTRRALTETQISVTDDCALQVTASLGVAELSPDDLTADDVLQRADKALYGAKEAGRNRVSAA